MQARYYDPVIGRFLSIDPVGFSPGRPFMFNRYAYVGNDPIGQIDPSGESPVNLIGGAISAAVYWATAENPTISGAVVSFGAGFLGGPLLNLARNLGRTGMTAMAGRTTLVTTVNGMPTAVPLAPVAGMIGEVAGAMGGGAAIGGTTQVATNIADAVETGQSGNLTNPLARADTAAAAGMAAGIVDFEIPNVGKRPVVPPANASRTASAVRGSVEILMETVELIGPGGTEYLINKGDDSCTANESCC